MENLLISPHQNNKMSTDVQNVDLLNMCCNGLAWSLHCRLLTFGCFALSRQERSPLVPLRQQDTLGVLAAHFAKVPSGGGETVGQFSGTSLSTAYCGSLKPVQLLQTSEKVTRLCTIKAVLCCVCACVGKKKTPHQHFVFMCNSSFHFALSRCCDPTSAPETGSLILSTPAETCCCSWHSATGLSDQSEQTASKLGTGPEKRWNWDWLGGEEASM